MTRKIGLKLLVLALFTLCALALPATAQAAQDAHILSAPAQTGGEPPAPEQDQEAAESAAVAPYVRAIALALARTLDFVSVVPDGVTLSFNVPVGDQVAAVTLHTQDVETFSLVATLEQQTIELRGLKLKDDAFALDSASLVFRDGVGTVTLSGLKLADGSLSWDGVQAGSKTLISGDIVTISDFLFALTNTGSAVAADASARISLTAGETAQGGGWVQFTFDPGSPQLSMRLDDGALALRWGDLGMDAQNVAYQSGVWTAATTTAWWSPSRLTAFMSDVRLEPAQGLDFTTLGAEIDLEDTPIRFGNANLQKFVLSVTKSDTGYIMTTQSHLSAPTASGQ